jgi:septum formation protein
VFELPAGVRLVLASASPRRSELLRQLGVDFDIRPADIDESTRHDETPIAYVHRLSIEKATAVSRRADVGASDVVVAADTTVELGGQILGKPTDRADAFGMLTMLSGTTHRVHTGVTIRQGDRASTGCVTTEVTFAVLSADDIEWYVATGEPFDKAGAYAVQGAGGALVARIDGSVSNVIGLPLVETIAMIRSTVEPVVR